MHTWTWTTYRDNTYLRCSLLDNWQHGFFTQQWWPQSPYELVHAISPQAQAYRVKQVHGNTVLTIEEWKRQQSFYPDSSTFVSKKTNSNQLESLSLPEADGIISNQSTDSVWAASADCVPALIVDDASSQVAAVHAGWRGTAQQVIPVAIQRLLKQGTRPGNLRVALGPAIAGKVYQVSTIVAAQVGATVIQNIHEQNWGTHRNANGPINFELSPNIDNPTQPIEEILSYLKSLDRPPVLDDPQPGRVRLDVRRINELQLEQLGLTPEQIAIAPYCTYQNQDCFFSYRRQRQKKVQWSGIVSNG